MSSVISLMGSGEDARLHFLMLHTTGQVLLKFIIIQHAIYLLKMIFQWQAVSFFLLLCEFFGDNISNLYLLRLRMMSAVHKSIVWYMKICVKLNPFWNVLATINDSLNSYCIYVQNRESGPLKSYCLVNQAEHIYPFYPRVHERKDFHCCSFWEQCLETYWSVSRIIYFPRNQKLCRSHLHKEEKIWKSWNFRTFGALLENFTYCYILQRDKGKYSYHW